MVYEKLKIELSEENERKLREIYQFDLVDGSFEVFVNKWISNELYFSGF